MPSQRSQVRKETRAGEPQTNPDFAIAGFTKLINEAGFDSISYHQLKYKHLERRLLLAKLFNQKHY